VRDRPDRRPASSSRVVLPLRPSISEKSIEIKSVSSVEICAIPGAKGHASMAGYVSSRESYAQYLRQQALPREVAGAIETVGRDVTVAISRAAREQVASLDAMRRAEIRIAAEHAAGQERLLMETQTTNSTLEKLDARFQWGVSTLIANVGTLGASLDKIVQSTWTPNRTRAYEYYGDAREAYSRRHFVEATQAIEKALNGDSSATTGAACMRSTGAVRDARLDAAWLPRPFDPAPVRATA
jgi:BMFP domain-containing protein YqiC